MRGDDLGGQVLVADAHGNCVGDPDEVTLAIESDDPSVQADAVDLGAACGPPGEPGARPVYLAVRAGAPRQAVPRATLTIETRYRDATGAPRTFTRTIRACVLSP